MLRKSVRYLAGSAFALTMLATSAQAVTIPVGENTAATAYLLADGTTYVGNVYFATGGVTPAGAFTDTFYFEYAPPPALTNISTTTNNILSTLYGIDGFTFTWGKDGDAPLFSDPDGIITGQLLPLDGAGIYVLTLTGTARQDGGQYTLSLASTQDAPGDTPIPGAVLLFGSVLAGGVGLMRRRRSVAQAA